MFLFLKIEIFIKLRNRIVFLKKITLDQHFSTQKKVCEEIVVGKK